MPTSLFCHILGNSNKGYKLQRWGETFECMAYLIGLWVYPGYQDSQFKVGKKHKFFI
jgi:hypothetical protein